MDRQERRVLLVDDHEMVRSGLKALLGTRPHLQIVAEAADGRAALEAACQTKPDIAIVDYSLPDLSGFDLTRALKRELPKVEVLIYTMHDREEVIFDVLRAGASGYVLKSDTEDELFAAIDALSIHRPYFSGVISETLLDRVLSAAPDQRTTLTHREREVVQLIAEGKMNKEIAFKLDLSAKTVETHRAAAMSKLKLRNTAELVCYAVRNNIVVA